MPRIPKTPVKIFDAKAATGTSTVYEVEDARHVVISVSAAVNSTLTFLVKGSILPKTQTTLSSAQTVANQWDYLSCYDLSASTTIIPGNTGVALNDDTVVNNTRQYLIDTRHMNQIALEITAYTDGSLTAWAAAAND